MNTSKTDPTPTADQTLTIFDHEQIRRAVGFADLIDPVARAFAEFSQGLGEAPIATFAPAGEAGDVHVKSAWLAGHHVFTVKVGAWFAARATAGRSAASGYVAVHDATTGDLVAIMRDEHHLTDVRTAAAGAVATRLLARADARVLAVLGTGTQAYLQTLAAHAVRPIDTVLVWGRNRESAERLRATLAAAEPGLCVSVADKPQDAVRAADVIVTATGSKRPIVEGSWLRTGQHVTALGADDPAKAELDPECFRRADLLVVDSRGHAPHLGGDLRAAIAGGAVTAEAIDADLGGLVLGDHPGRRDPDQITIAKLIGLGIQDLAAAETALSLLSRPPRPGRAPASAMDLLEQS